tara:strand:- start:402 stop:560 length:159 start_codon:yes stop_codon:yes gene_type:complete
MTKLKVFKKDGNRSVCVVKYSDSEFTAMTYSESKTFKTERGAFNWMAKRGCK